MQVQGAPLQGRHRTSIPDPRAALNGFGWPWATWRTRPSGTEYSCAPEGCVSYVAQCQERQRRSSGATRTRRCGFLGTTGHGVPVGARLLTGGVIERLLDVVRCQFLYFFH